MNLPKDKRKRLVIFLAGFVVVLGLVSLFEPIYGQICHYNEYKDAERCHPDHLVVSLIHDAAVFVNDGSAFLTAAATLGLVVVTWLLVRLGQEQSKTTQAQLRAYVFNQRTEISPINQNPVIVSIIAKNTGQTPAYNVVSFAARRVGRFQNPEPFPPVDRTVPATRNNLGPDAESTKSWEFTLSPQIVQRINSGEWAIWFWGTLEYEDAFGEKQWTTYRLFYGGPTGTIRRHLTGDTVETIVSVSAAITAHALTARS